MAVELHTGQVQGVCKIATGTPTALCRALTGGSVSISQNVIQKKGTGGQIHSRPGTISIEVSLDCIGVAAADIALWFPTAAGVAVASFPDLLVVQGSNQHILSGGQPMSISASCDNGADAEITYSLKAVYAGYASTTGAAVVYNALLGHTLYDITAQIGAADADIMSFSLENDLGGSLFNAMNTRSAQSKRFATGSYVTGQDPKVSFVSSKQLPVTDMNADVPAVNDIVFTLANGTAGENVTFTCNDFYVNSWEDPVEVEGVIGFSHELVPASGTQYSRIVVT